MNIDSYTNSNQSNSFKKTSIKKAQFLESFHNILQRSLNNKSNTRPPKIQLSGLLIPCQREFRGRTFKFKLGAVSTDYLLSMNTHLLQLAKNVAWEEVTVLGYLDLESSVIDVEKIFLTQTDEPLPISSNMGGAFEIDTFERIINQRGKLEPSLEFLAS